MPDELLFDRYRLLAPAGRGGSAEVWRARDELTGDEVAVKRLHPVVFADEAGQRRLRREFDALRSLDEPHVVRVRDLVIGEREAALVLDFVDGESLATRLAALRAAGERMSPDAVVRIVDDVAAALSAAHAAGIVHRDVTPANVLLGPDDEAHLTDFGIAHAEGDDTAAVTATGLMMGTMRYLAPEQLRGGTSTAASDLHGLAAIAYEMLAGRPAYEPTSPVALAEAQEAGPPVIADVEPAVDAAVRRGLAVDPASRPATVAAFAADLRAAVDAASHSGTAEVGAGPADRTAVFVRPAAIAGGLAAGAGVGAGAGVAAVAGAAGAASAGAADPAGDDIGIASPSRAAALIDRPHPASVPDQAAYTADAPRDERSIGARRPTPGSRRRIPAPVAVGLGLVLAIGLLAAATRLDSITPPGALPAASLDGAVASHPPSARPTPRPTPTPTPAPAPKDPGGKGKGHGKGKGG